jgi:hypothetical protein
VLANLIVAVLVTLLCKALRAPDGIDATAPDDYVHDPDAAAAPVVAADELPDPVPAV